MGIILRITFILLCLPNIFFGQTKHQDGEYYKWFDQVIGQENTGLYNGKQYVDPYVNRIINDRHAYFYSDKPLIGSVIYDKQTYYDVKMRYNLEIDQLLIHPKPGGVASILQLIFEKVDEFVINGFKFIKVENFYEDGSVIKGFYLVLAENEDILLLKRIIKSKARGVKQVIGDRLQYKFVSTSKYILYTKDIYRDVKSKKDIIENFPELKKEIKQFFKTYRSLQKKDSDIFMQRLFSKIIELQPTKNKS